ncbi:hypothetical protein FACS189461_5050 [Spirochaetia bacterium]|nr:hypothetical protein FACS189461_5050 [Spirochaetia bacterium]
MTNAISRVELKDFLVFKSDFAVDFCPGVNVLIGGNGSGKTTLLKCLYWACEFSKQSVLERNRNIILNFTEGTPFRTISHIGNYFLNVQPDNGEKEDCNSTIRLFSNTISDTYPVLNVLVSDSLSSMLIPADKSGESLEVSNVLAEWCRQKVRSVFIPVTEMLQHSKGLLALEREREIPFDKTQIDILSKAELGETHEITLNASKLLGEIKSVIMGEVICENDTFFIVKTDGHKIPFSLEASGFQKFGLLWKLLRNGLLESGSILFWDEPEASVNPELIPALIDILLELQKGGVQIFIATHSYDVARWFELNKKTENSLRYFNLRKTDSGIAADVAEDYVSLPNSVIEDAGDKLLRRVTEVAAEKAGVALK